MFKLSQIRFSRNRQTLLTIPDLAIDSNSITVIIGPNGSGKSTLLQLLSHQLKPDSGTLLLHQQPLGSYSQRKLAQAVAYLPQHQPPAAGLTVQELVKLGRFPWRGLLGRMQASDLSIIEQAMTMTHVKDYSSRLVEELSGGERQRAWIAMLLAQQSPILMLDEPTSALDIVHQYELMKLLQQLNQNSQRGVILVLHDLNLALRFADNLIALRQGEVVFQGSANALENADTISAIYDLPVCLLDHPNHSTKVVAPC